MKEYPYPEGVDIDDIVTNKEVDLTSLSPEEAWEYVINNLGDNDILRIKK